MSVAFVILVIVLVLAMFVWASANRRITQSGVPEGRRSYLPDTALPASLTILLKHPLVLCPSS